MKKIYSIAILTLMTLISFSQTADFAKVSNNTPANGSFFVTNPEIISGTSIALTGNISSNGSFGLKWTVANEADCLHFEVERKVANEEFKTVAYVMPNEANSNMPYMFREKAGVATTQYRIKQVTVSGKVIYTAPVVFSKINNSAEMSLYPSPATDHFIISNVPSEGKMNVSLYDINGKFVRSTPFIANNKISLQGVQPGLYLVKVTGEQNQFQSSSKLMVK